MGRQGPARNWIGLEQFVRWAFDHVVTKAASIDASAVVDLYHVEQYGETQVLAFLDKAVNDVTSAEHASLYEFLLAVFNLFGFRSCHSLQSQSSDPQTCSV